MASQPNTQLPLQDQADLSSQRSPSPQSTPIIAVKDIRRDAPDPVEEHHQATVPGANWILRGIGSKAWQVAMLVIPILLTFWLTHVSARSEKNVTDRINQQALLQKQQLDQQKQVFVEQVQLSQDLYKRQFDTYDKLYAQLLILRSTLEDRTPGNPSVALRRMADSLFELDNLRRANHLHISDSVYDSMGDAWQKGARMRAEDLDQVETKMQKELKDLMDVDAKLRK